MDNGKKLEIVESLLGNTMYLTSVLKDYRSDLLVYGEDESVDELISVLIEDLQCLGN